MCRLRFFLSSGTFALALTLAAGPPAHAGDLLRGGAVFGTAARATTPYGTNASETAEARTNAADALARTTNALQAINAMQTAARKAAQTAPSTVPDGLAPGGLQLAPNIAPVGANLPTQSMAGSKTTVNITQTAQQAVVNWQTFNIGSKTKLNFDQSAGGSSVGDWIVFNKIEDPSGEPSQILGSIQAQGQVYVINQNGILFGGGSQVNVHTLVASSLPINDNLIARGLLNNPDLQFLFSALAIPVLPSGTEPAFTPPAPLTANGMEGDVVVQPGAVLSAPTTPAHVGGRIALVGPNVTNGGTISTPDGQTILAAGLQVGFAAHDTSDPSLRGLDVSIGSVTYGGNATNTGYIEAPRADVTMAGENVNQLGGIDSSTSVSLNGRIDLLANYDTVRVRESGGDYVLSPSAAGSVTLGPRSVTQILPELSSVDTVVGASLALPSQINMQGETIHMESQASVLAPDATVTINAGDWVSEPPGFAFANTVGQIYLDSGAMLDVAGSVDVPVPISQNIIAAQLRGTELADSPLQRNGLLRGLTVDVDIRETGIYNGEAWIGTPLADVSGYVGIVERTVGQLTTSGGSVTMNAGGSIVMQPGSTVNVSGGYVNYQGGMVQTTRVVSGGEVFDISNATPNMVYSGIYTGIFASTHAKWGITQTFMDPLLLAGAHYEAGYIQGGNGGAINITAPSTALDGNLIGNTVTGPRQRSLASSLNPSILALLTQFGLQTEASAPAMSSLSLVYQGESATLSAAGPEIPPNIIFETGRGGLAPADPFSVDALGNPMPLRTDRQAEVVLQPDLLGADGFGSLTVYDDNGNISVPVGTTLTTQAGGALSLTGANISIKGAVSAPGGSLSLTAAATSTDPPAVQPDNATTVRGNFSLGSGASLSAAGLIVDDRAQSPTAQTLPLVTGGGSVSITALDMDLAPGSSINVSGGVSVGTTGKAAYGNAGSMSIDAGSELTLGASLSGFAGSGANAGSLSISAPLVQIGGTPNNPGTLLLQPGFFSQGGFGSFGLGALGAPTDTAFQYVPAILITRNTVIEPVVTSMLALPDGAGGTLTLAPTVLPEGVRPPVNLSFSAPGVTNDVGAYIVRGDFVMEPGAAIQTAPGAVASVSSSKVATGGGAVTSVSETGANVSINANTATVLGSITAPGGSISISGGRDSTALFANMSEALPTVDLGPRSVLSVAGATVLTADPRGNRTGSVLAGGNITVKGNIAAEAGAVLDVSGASNTLDLPPSDSEVDAPLTTSLSGSPVMATHVESNAGSINLAGSQELFTDATLIGNAGGPGAVGGSLTVSSGIFDPSAATVLTPTMLVTQNGPTIPTRFYPAGQTAIGNPVVDADGNALGGLGHFVASSFDGHGFTSLNLPGTVEFSGPVTFTAKDSLVVANSGVILADPAAPDSSLTLNAPYVAVGMAFLPPPAQQIPVDPFQSGGAPFNFSPTYGTASLTVNAGLIDIGSLSLQNIGKASFIAKNGDVRGDGTLDVAGDIFLRAGQIYPPTGVNFTIAAYDYVNGAGPQLGSVTIAASGKRQLPLSAGGQLDVYGSIINQGGVLRAPLGGINLGWDGEGTGPTDIVTNETFAVTQQLTLSAGSITSVSAVDPLTGQALIIPYGINVNGTEWIDPSGTDITNGGVPTKTVNLSALSITQRAGSSIDIRGGGDLYAYRFVQGLGGAQDILASNASFAVIPGYQADYSPYGAYNNPNPSTSAPLGTDLGYVNQSLAVGSQVYLGAGSGLPAGTYTLLPARYALLPGAFLVTPRSGAAPGAVSLPDGSDIVSGYRTSLGETGQPLVTSFEVDSQSVVRSRAEYDDFFANSFLAQTAVTNGQPVPRLPIDGGHLVFEATQSMVLEGGVEAGAPPAGEGGLIDISSPLDIVIASVGAEKPGELVLGSSELSSFGAESLLIGGIRQIGANGTTITVTTDNITVDDAGAPLKGEDVILAANDTITVDANSRILSEPLAMGEAETLLLGDASVPGSGDGALLRVSGDPTASIARSGVDTADGPAMDIAAGAQISGGSVILDSTRATSLDPDAVIKGQSVALDSGQISIQLDNPGALNPTTGLVLSGLALQTLQASSQALSLLSYSSLDIYGTGQVGSAAVASLALHAAEIRGFNNGGGMASFAARSIVLDNIAGGSVPGPIEAAAGTLAFNASTIGLGANQIDVDQYAGLTLNASGGVIAQASGALSTQGSLAITTPLVTAATGVTYAVSVPGAITIQPLAKGAPTVGAGLGGSLTFQGASILADGDILLPSGQLTLHATTGDVVVGGRLDAGGTQQIFFNLIKYTDGGQITLTSDAGSVTLSAPSVVNVAAQPGGGNAGTFAVSAAQGDFTGAGTLLGQGGAGGEGGSFSLDVNALPDLTALDNALNAASFSQSRSFRVRTGDVSIGGLATAQFFNLSADQGSITVTGAINASGPLGGTIALEAYGDVTLESGASLSVAAQQFDDAGEGGSVSLETTNGTVTLANGSTVDLSVAGGVGGTLHLRAPQTTNDVAIAALAGNVVNASNIVAEGFFAQDAASASPASIDSFEAAAKSNATAFMTNAGAITTRLLQSNPGLAGGLNVEPGEEIDNSLGALVLNNDWDFSTLRYGTQQTIVDQHGNIINVGVEPGILTLRAAGSITFNGSLTDGFGDSEGDVPTVSGHAAAWEETLLPLFQNGTPQRSWSYVITSGADFTANDSQALPLASLGANSGSILLGRNAGIAASNNGTTVSVAAGHYQVIRTGAGSIDVTAGANVELLNQFATIYTAGALIPNPTMGGAFAVPILHPGTASSVTLYPAQYSDGGGNVTIYAQGDIEHETQNGLGVLIPDSERQLPIDWLYRRGYVNTTTGLFGATRFGDLASTTWWVDFSNFFEGVGALGGGNVTMTAGGDIDNVDAAVPTNARMPSGAPNAASLVELGGGDLLVRAGGDINGGVYYVERGEGTLEAGNEIVTNSTRSPDLGILGDAPPFPEADWLPTTLFLGQGSFNVSARGNLLLGPVANPFLLSPGLDNTVWDKTYFSTYGASDSVNVSSLTGDVTLRESATLPGDQSTTPMLESWLENVLLLSQDAGSTAASYQPWVEIVDTNTDPFNTVAQLLPPKLTVTAFSGNLDLDGNLTLTPSPVGSIDFAVAGSINGLQPNGPAEVNLLPVTEWSSSTIDLSDANPASIPGIATPFGYESLVGTRTTAESTQTGFLDFLDAFFDESGSTIGTFGVLQTKQALHAPGVLHAGDTDPVRLYARTGNISGLTFFSPKETRVVAGGDITDVGLYVQNDRASDISVVSAGGDVEPYDPQSPLLTAAEAVGNAFDTGSGPESGDIQISGPGTLEVLAGRNLNLGVGPNNADGTGVGISSIGNARNPNLPFAGASVIAGAGIGVASELDSSRLDFSKFIADFLDPLSGGIEAMRYLPDLGQMIGGGTNDLDIWEKFSALPLEERDALALQIFYLVLRDAGRDHNDPTSPGFNNYTEGTAAIADLFPHNKWKGDILLTSREIITDSGGNISLFAPGGQVTVGVDVAGNQPLNQGILTEDGGNINIFTQGDVNVGTSRIFTLRGGNEIIWSSEGNIDAGASSKTVQSAPPTRVLVDPQSGNVQTDLAGLATGGGIGVLETVVGVPPADVDLIAPVGTVDAGDAGIRVSGNLNISAKIVLNASNIQVSGASVGVPAPVVVAPNLGGLTAASSAAGASASTATEATKSQASQEAPEEVPSLITVEVVGYGGGDGD